MPVVAVSAAWDGRAMMAQIGVGRKGAVDVLRSAYLLQCV